MNEVTKMNTIVLSVYPCCGPKGRWYDYIDEYKIEVVRVTDFMYHITMHDDEESMILNRYAHTELSSDEISDLVSQFCTNPNPDYPGNFINHIKSLIGKVDFIIVNDWLQSRELLTENGIKFITVMPNFRLRTEWMTRILDAGYGVNHAISTSHLWATTVGTVEEEPHGLDIIRLQSCEHLDLDGVKRNYESLFKEDETK